jgi:hypothetical protein
MSNNHNDLPKLDLSSFLTNMPNLVSSDIEENLIPQVNFKYYTVDDFNSRNEIAEKVDSFFSVFHCNIRSLGANFDMLTTLLSSIQYKFSVIGLTETRIVQNKKIITNTDLLGYKFISQPTLHSAGGVGFYVDDSLKYHIREDFTISTDDFEGLWIEINCQSQRNILCGVTYRHPNANLENFSNYIFKIIDKISKENCNS